MFIKNVDGNCHVDVDAIVLLEKKKHENFENHFFLIAYTAIPVRTIELVKEASESEVDDLIKKIWHLKDRNDLSST